MIRTMEADPVRPAFPSSLESSRSCSRSTCEEGQELYMHFLESQMHSAHLSWSSLLLCKMNKWCGFGLSSGSILDSELYALASSFARSPSRQLVYNQAMQVDLYTLDMANFTEMLNHVFEEKKISKERIVVLFFFCSDLLIRAVGERLEQLSCNLTQWTLHYIQHTVCAWVESQGGWLCVLDTGLSRVQRLSLTAASLAILLVCSMYIGKALAPNKS